MITDYPVYYRRRPETPVPGLIRIDRALAYLIEQLAQIAQTLESMKTKGLGEYHFVIIRITNQLVSICAMSGEPFLVERIGHLISRFRYWNSRTPRADAIQAINEVIREMQAFEPIDRSSDSTLLEVQAEETAGKKASPSDLAKEGSLFVIMPFSQEFNDVWVGGIQAAVKNSTFNAIRVDTIARSANITDDIVESIKNCRITIVDVTGNNPNVMFELGYVMALEKPYVIISQSVDFLPFDIRNIRTIVYSNTWSGIEELKNRLDDFLKEFSTRGKTTHSKKKSSKS